MYRFHNLARDTLMQELAVVIMEWTLVMLIKLEILFGTLRKSSIDFFIFSSICFLGIKAMVWLSLLVLMIALILKAVIFLVSLMHHLSFDGFPLNDVRSLVDFVRVLNENVLVFFFDFINEPNNNPEFLLEPSKGWGIPRGTDSGEFKKKIWMGGGALLWCRCFTKGT